MMDTDAIQDLIMLLKGCYGDEISLVTVSLGKNNSPYMTYHTGTNAVCTVTSTTYTSIEITMMLHSPQILPQVMQDATIKMGSTVGDVIECKMVTYNLKKFVDDVKKELHEMYSHLFDQFMDKLLTKDEE